MVDYYAPTRRPATALTEDEWFVDGVSINSLAFNIARLDGSREGPPGVRGENLLVPLRPGRIWAEKFPEERTITLGMWIQGVDPQTGAPPDTGSNALRRQFKANWQHLIDLFYKPWREIKLTKKWKDPATGTIKSASAQVTYAGGLEGMEHQGGPGRGIVVIDLIAAEPYFYDDTEYVWNVEVANALFEFNNPGYDIHRKLTVEIEAITALTGPPPLPAEEDLTTSPQGSPINFTFINQTPSPDVWFGMNLGVTAGSKFVLDTLNFTATRTAGFGQTNVTGWVQNAGTRHWMLLLPGINWLRLSTKTGEQAKATVRFRPQYF